MDRLGELGVVPHAVAVAPDVDDVAAVQQSVEQGGGHDLVAEDVAPLLEALVRGQDRRGALVAPVDELEEEDGAGIAARVSADRKLALSVARHWAMFVRDIGSTGRKIDGRAAVPGNLLLPPGGAEEALAEDYASILTTGVYSSTRTGRSVRSCAGAP